MTDPWAREKRICAEADVRWNEELLERKRQEQPEPPICDTGLINQMFAEAKYVRLQRRAALYNHLRGPVMHIHNSLDEARDIVIAAQRDAGFPIDDSGVRKLLISLRALGLIDWVEPKKEAAA